MKNQADEITAFLLANISQHPKDIVAVTGNSFAVTRTTVHRHLNKLIKAGKVIQTGTTRQTTYCLRSTPDKELCFKIQPEVEESRVWKEYLLSNFSNLSENVLDICQYGFTEMFNNALDHSEGQNIVVKTIWTSETVEIIVHDDGAGIFQKIKRTFGLIDERESILQLSKGKLTTDPERHSGEGIFFTSRAFDFFDILANGLYYHKDNTEDDWFVEQRDHVDDSGTTISMSIALKSERRLLEVFEQFTHLETKAFDKTHLLVELSKLQEERYISRSQAKRVTLGLEKFKHIVLDFKEVKTVGQAFVDEVFRVFRNQHPEIQIDYIHANEDVTFMIERGLPK